MTRQLEQTIRSQNSRARRTALEAMQLVYVDATGLVSYQSRGKVAVIGDRMALALASHLDKKLQPELVLLESEDEQGLPAPPPRIEGHLGAFRIQLDEPDGPSARTLEVDLVLDLSPEPVLNMALTPAGYLHVSADEDGLSAASEALSEMVGSFESPVFVDYDAGICAHGRNGKTACTACIDTCPATAITSLAERIEVDPFLCQGGGGCATVCPSGAIRYLYPNVKDTLSRLRALLRTYNEEGGSDPVILIHTGSAGDLFESANNNLLPFMVEELASVGLETWLSALAYGARGVWLLHDDDIAAAVMDAVQGQIGIATEILQALGYPQESVRLVNLSELQLPPPPVMPEIQVAGYSGVGGKRTTTYMAIDHLYAQAERVKPVITLEVGAPFGAAFVEEGACTLCLSCVGACPGNALQSGGDEPKLSFIEANCIQCGICTRTCPEDAIWITPRLLLDAEDRRRARLLCQEAPFHCSSCGKPFATKSTITNMLNRLQGHWMFQSERSRKRLTMCGDCRVVDIADDLEAVQSSQDGAVRQ
ncbi:MAG: hypothetical protein GY814_06370 [Gammaproteobacteria bacterium]|nr:hypothetical protein [Gammaproteobacteria bacterium]